MSLSDMTTNLINELTAELSDIDMFNADKLAIKVNSAIRTVKQIRKYPADYTDDMITADMSRFYDVCYQLALARYNRIGADLEESHSENGLNISYVSEGEILKSVLPIAIF